MELSPAVHLMCHSHPPSQTGRACSGSNRGTTAASFRAACSSRDDDKVSSAHGTTGRNLVLRASANRRDSFQSSTGGKSGLMMSALELTPELERQLAAPDRLQLPLVTRRSILAASSTFLLGAEVSLHAAKAADALPPVGAEKDEGGGGGALVRLYDVADNSVLDFSEADEEEERVIRIFEEASKSVVSITLVDQPAGGGSEEKVLGKGSGFVWDRFGHVVTNFHVISPVTSDRSGRKMMRVTFSGDSGSSSSGRGGGASQSPSLSFAAEVVGIDPGRDLAVIRPIAAADADVAQISFNPSSSTTFPASSPTPLSPLSPLTPVTLGTSSDLLVGQSCFAIGNPLGLSLTLTSGLVSGLGRQIPAPNGQSIGGVIQTDAAINSGNSGGPLFDSSGRVIGVNTATFTRSGTGISSGVNFAIPIDTVAKIVPRLIVYGGPSIKR